MLNKAKMENMDKSAEGKKIGWSCRGGQAAESSLTWWCYLLGVIYATLKRWLIIRAEPRLAFVFRVSKWSCIGWSAPFVLEGRKCALHFMCVCVCVCKCSDISMTYSIAGTCMLHAACVCIFVVISVSLYICVCLFVCSERLKTVRVSGEGLESLTQLHIFTY